MYEQLDWGFLDGSCLYRSTDCRRHGRYIIYFTKLWDEFEQIDRDHDNRLTLQEFIVGASAVGHSMSRAEAQHEVSAVICSCGISDNILVIPIGLCLQFAAMDANHGGVVLFDEFVGWCAHREHVADHLAEEQAEAALAQQQQTKQVRGTS